MLIYRKTDQETFVEDTVTGDHLDASILDHFMLNGSEPKVGIRYWDKDWYSWSYEIVDLVDGIDLTHFFDKLGLK